MVDSVDVKFKRWLTANGEASPPPANVVAFNFGLFETENGYVTYLTGSSEYDPDDDDWACEPDYEPIEKYFVFTERPTNQTDWRSVPHEVAESVKRFLESDEGAKSFLAKPAIITIGFDDGDLTRVS